jgi:LPS-assembly lipoprotein
LALLPPLILPLLLAMAGCGWTPLYADPQSGPAQADLRAVKVAPIAERIGQKLELALRTSFNPSGVPTPPRYVLHTTLSILRLDLGITTQGLGTRFRLEVQGSYSLNDIRTGAVRTKGSLHVTQSFDIQANQYSNVVAEEDSRTRAVEELRDDILIRLRLFFQEHPGAAAITPAAAQNPR